MDEKETRSGEKKEEGEEREERERERRERRERKERGEIGERRERDRRKPSTGVFEISSCCQLMLYCTSKSYVLRSVHQRTTEQ